jgi:hypothetical protein
MIVDSGTTPAVPIYVYGYTNESDVVVWPYPNNVPIEGDPADCGGWPNGDQTGDQHSIVIDRNTCWEYEAWITNRCNGLYSVNNSAIWDLQDGNYRPFGLSSADAGGLSIMAGLVKYDEAASGTINHAIRYTMRHARTDSDNGYFVEPASHASGGVSTAPTVEGMRLRLKSSFDTSGYSTVNKAILTALRQYGMIMADIGGNFLIGGSWDPRWNVLHHRWNCANLSDQWHDATLFRCDYRIRDGDGECESRGCRPCTERAGFSGLHHQPAANLAVCG